VSVCMKRVDALQENNLKMLVVKSIH
jgi:hypothetical protein